jgi:hypothetical protein
MEFIDGESLSGTLKREGKLSVENALKIMHQTAQGLATAHDKGVIHRDIKPGNVLRGAGGLWKLADFGVAHMPDSDVTISGQFLGTPAYAAPEALTLGQFSPASDVFGLAATLYEAATGTRPHGDATMADLVKTAHRPVIDPHAIPPALGVLGPILAAGLAVAPEARPSAAQMAELLAGSGSTETRTAALPARAVGLPALPALPAQLPRWAFVVAVIVLLIGLLALADRLGGSGEPPLPGTRPSAGPSRGAPGGPRTFSSPRNLDGRGGKDWRKVAEKVREGDFDEALHKLEQFEDRHGASPESAELRRWLQSQAIED